MQVTDLANNLYSRSEILINSLDKINERIDDFATKIEIADEKLETLRLQTTNLTIVRADKNQLVKVSRRQESALSISLMINCFLFIGIVFVVYVVSESASGNFL